VVAAVLFGASVVAVRIAVEDIHPLDLAVLRFAQGATILLVVLALYAPSRLRIHLRDLPLLTLLGAIFFSAFPLTFNTALKFTDASRGALMLATMPVWSIVLARYLARERLSHRQIAGVTLTVAGVGLAVAGDGIGTNGNSVLLGDALMLVTAFLGALYGVIAKRALIIYSPLTVTTYAMAIGTILLLPAALPGGFGGMSIDDRRLLEMVLFLGVFGGALSYFLWTSALSALSPTRVAAYVNLNPVVAALLGIFLLSEPAELAFFAGFVTVVAGVCLVNVIPSLNRAAPEGDQAARATD
jgi:drug/metabolite transporter (DMT)-like permease